MGFFKKLKDTAEKSIEKGVELGTKGYDSAKEAATRGYEKARDEQIIRKTQISESPKQIENVASPSQPTVEMPLKISQPSGEALQILKLRLANGEITKEEFEEMKSVLQE